MSLKVRRLLAALIDYFIGVFSATLLVAVVTLGKLDTNFYTVVMYLVAFVLWGMFKDCIFKKASIGKKLLRIHIANANDSEITVWDIIKRNVTLVVFPIEVLALLYKGKRLGDAFSQTFVVNDF